MDFNSTLFLLMLYSLIAIIITIVISALRKKPKYSPDYNNSIPVIEIIQSLEKTCPIGTTTKWRLIPFDYGSHRCWMQNTSLPSIHKNLNLYASTVLLSSSSANICSFIADVAKWSEWNPFCSTQYVVKSFYDKQLRRDHYMEAEQVVSVVRETNKIQAHTYMYRFHDFSENKVGWLLFWNARKCEFMFFLIQPIKSKNDKPMCLLTHIVGAESNYCSSSASLVLQRLRNIEDLVNLSSVNVALSKSIVPTPPVCEEPTAQNKTQTFSSSFQENYFALSSIRARKREVRNTMFILVPFVSSFYIFWEKCGEYKLAVKNLHSSESEKKSSVIAQKKELVSNSKLDFIKKSLRRTLSSVEIKSEALNISKVSDTSDFGKDSSAKKSSSESKEKLSDFQKQNSDTSEESEFKNKPIENKKFLNVKKLLSLSETAVNKLNDCEYELNKGQHEPCGKLGDINENVGNKVVAMYEQDYKEMYNSSVSDFEIVENCEFTENRIAGFMTQGNYGASELQAEILLASHFEHDINSGNVQFAGDWMFHSTYKGLNVLTKTTCCQFMKICSFLCQTEISVAPLDVWRFVKNPQFRFICDESVKSVEVLEKISSSQKLIHTYHEVPGFLKKELIDFCLLQTEREELNKYYSSFFSIEFDKCPFMNSVTRGTLRPSGWIVEKIDKNPKKSKVSYMIQVLVNSPDSLFIQELSTVVPQSVHNLRNYVTTKPM